MIAAAHALGWLSFALLAASLAISLRARWQHAEIRVKSLALRRWAGLAGSALAFLHATSSVALLEPADPAGLVAMVEGLPFLRHGALALALLALLAATSFPRLNARLGLRAWGALHRVVYAAIALAALHVLAGPSADPRVALVATVVVAILLAGRLVPRRARVERSDEAVTTGPPDNP
ncbi:MAG: hypothetical protein OHK0013_24130 [Sandaracinaceae bacterium]